MPGLNATLTWAIPIAAEVLGAHLDAYLTLLPTINTLRACHEYAQDKPVSRLSVELISIIEDFLIAEEREKQSADWRRDFACFQQQCDEEDHLSEEEREHISLEDCTEHFSSMLSHDSCTSCLENRLGVACIDRCMQRYHGWQDRELTFYRRKDILVKNFGLRIWSETARLDADYRVFETTISYLVLPRSTVFRSEWNLSEQETDGVAEDHEFNFSTGCAMELGTNLSLPEGAKKKFYANDADPWSHTTSSSQPRSCKARGGERARGCSSWRRGQGED